MTSTKKSDWLFTTLCWIQGAYYLTSGVWPLISIRTFKVVTGERGKTDHLVTGRESDHWLIMTVGVLVTAIALTLLLAAYRKSQPLELVLLAVGAAAGLAAIDMLYTWRGVIPPIYLADAALEVLLILVWLRALSLKTSGPGQTPSGT